MSYAFTNRLAREKSPYLLQHAHNPVDWYPWGAEAFEAAKVNDKPIFLSIGYATCHWCHVMEKESFENPEIAKLMNDSFISIKVDREELPHIDSLYMEFAQSMMSGAAGWPLNLILTPDLQPFFAATYLPPTSKQGLIGLPDLIQRIHEVWEGEEREKVLDQAQKIVDVFAQNVHVKGEELPEKDLIEDACEVLFKMSDPVYGGMKGAPKFPIGYQYNFMLNCYATLKDGRALFLVQRTLDRMHRGGIYDHLGGGFARYSVDEQWLVPHFEKMLYDNALLIETYLAAWQVTRSPLFEEVCREIMAYILRDMTHREGGFYSAEDADSDGHEGLFYTWTLDEIKTLLGASESELFCAYYGVSKKGNFEGRVILNTPLVLEEFATMNGKDPIELKKLFDSQRKILWEEREKRPHPLKDDKILSSWNGLMIAALAKAGRALNDDSAIQAALSSVQFIRKNLWKKGRLLRRWRDGEASFAAGLDEYAYLIDGLLTLFETGCGTEWLQWAFELTQILKNEFKVDGGAFYQADPEDASVILRKTLFSDGAEPSGNAIQCENLLRLYGLSQEPEFLDQAEDVLRASHKFLELYAPGYCYHFMNLNRYYNQQRPTLVVALNETEEHKAVLLKEIFSAFIPHKTVIWRKVGDAQLFHLLPFVESQAPLKNKTTLYICHEGVCKAPLTELDAMLDALHKL